MDDLAAPRLASAYFREPDCWQNFSASHEENEASVPARDRQQAVTALAAHNSLHIPSQAASDPQGQALQASTAANKDLLVNCANEASDPLAAGQASHSLQASDPHDAGQASMHILQPASDPIGQATVSVADPRPGHGKEVPVASVSIPEGQAPDGAGRDRAGSCFPSPSISGQPKLLTDDNFLKIAKLNLIASTSSSTAHPTNSPLNAHAPASLLASSTPWRPKTVHVCEGAGEKMRNVIALSTAPTHLPYLFFGTLPTPLLPPDYPHHLSYSHTNGTQFLADPHMRDLHLGVGKQYNRCCFYCGKIPHAFQANIASPSTFRCSHLRGRNVADQVQASNVRVRESQKPFQCPNRPRCKMKKRTKDAE
ncbi:hypothetical protein L7F22_027545 [Adiantum nelumboides]|nr:hypothetical protein [Adiantum nelumboides]